MARPGVRLVLAGTVLLLALGGPAAAQQAPAKDQPKPAQREKLNEAEVDFVDSEHASWNTRSVNDTIFFAGQSVNSVMIEKNSSRVGQQVDLLFQPKVEEVEVTGAASGARTVIRIQGKEVDLDK